MNQITKGPNPTPQFGYDFDYSVWTPGTRIDLVNVNFNNDYRDVIAPDFDINKFIDSLSPSGISISDMTYVRHDHPIRVDIPFSRANRYNYLRATNPAQPVDGDAPTTFYYFILECRYVAGNTTQLVLQLDVWNTYINNVNFGNCYVEQGHIAIANTKAMDHYGRDYLTIPDGLDIGSAYRTISQHSIDIAGYTPENYFTQSLTNVMVISTTNLKAEPFKPDGKPNLETATGSYIQGLASGAAVYLFETIASFKSFMNNMREFPWITQGIVSITMVPTITRYVAPEDFTFEPSGVPSDFPGFNFLPIKHKFSNNWRQKIIDALPDRYKRLSRFLTSPYCLIEMTTWSGTPLQLKPELWNRDDMFVLERPTYLPPSQRVQFYPRGYNTYASDYLSIFGMTHDQLYAKWVPAYMTAAEFETMWEVIGDIGDDYGDYLDLVTQISSFPSVPIVNNMAISYLASNYNSLAYQRQSADWSQQRAMGSAQAQYDISSGAIATGQVLNQVGIAADTGQVAVANNAQAQQAGVNMLFSPLVGAAGGAFTGTPYGVGVGAVTGAIGGISNMIQTGIQMGANSEALAVRTNSAYQRNRAETGQMRLARDTNVDLARWAAKGDYHNAIAGINAKVQDAQMLQPSVSGQFGGDAANMIYGTMELNIRVKMIDLQAIRTVGEYWLRYGYPVRAFMTPPKSLMTMEKFTYWKMSETYINAANVPEAFKQTIRGILEKGVTVWANPNYIGQIDMADNAPLGGISY